MGVRCQWRQDANEVFTITDHKVIPIWISNAKQNMTKKKTKEMHKEEWNRWERKKKGKEGEEGKNKDVKE